MTMRRVFASLLTEDDADKVPDLSRIVWFALAILCVLAILLFLVVGVVVAVNGTTFDFVGFGTGFGAVAAGVAGLMAACGAALAMKTKSGA